MKYTVIYRDTWMTGSHLVTAIRKKNIETEDIKAWLTAFEFKDGMEYIFLGWPYLEGETIPEHKFKKIPETRTIRMDDEFVKRVVPHGIYCYDKNGLCPFWDKFEEIYPEQSNGYCAFLERGDWMDSKNGGTFLLWDQCKECGINTEDDNHP